MSTTSSSSSPPEATPPWIELPREITSTILQKLGALEILTAAELVCTTWRSVCKDVSMWRSIDMRSSDDHRWETLYDLVAMCRHAVDRSQGQLTEINIEYFGSDDLIVYIAQRSNQLRRLRLAFSYGISGENMSEAVKHIPLLEELHLYHTYFDPEAIEAVGRFCLQLKSFKLNNYLDEGMYILSDQEALAIAKSMPGLRHLQLLGNHMTDDGLQAILDGCLHLESLDLRGCFNLHLEGDLRKMCSQRIKYLRLPDDPIDDYEYYDEVQDYNVSDDDNITGFSDVDMASDYDYNSDDYLEFSGGSVSSNEEFFDDLG